LELDFVTFYVFLSKIKFFSCILLLYRNCNEYPTGTGSQNYVEKEEKYKFGIMSAFLGNTSAQYHERDK